MVKTKKKRKIQKNRGGNPHPSLESFIASSKALKGNAFWQQRSKHGRDILFESPQLMLEAAAEYFKWCDENPDIQIKPMSVSSGGNMGSSIEMVEVPVKRPYTLHGLCRYLNCNTSYFKNFKATKAYQTVEGFSAVIAIIEEAVFDQQFSGSANGFFNANIISRALGLIDKQDITTFGEKLSAPEFKVYNNAPPLASGEKNVDGKKK